MEFRYTPELVDYIKKHGKTTLLVEMVEVNNSDLDITELHIFFANKQLRERFVEKKRYRVFPTELGEVLLPRFPLEMDEVVTFGLKRFLWFSRVTCQGIRV